METTQASLKEIFWKVADTVILRHERLKFGVQRTDIISILTPLV